MPSELLGVLAIALSAEKPHHKQAVAAATGSAQWGGRARRRLTRNSVLLGVLASRRELCTLQL